MPLSDVEAVWPHCEPHISRAIAAVTTSETPEGILAEALADRNGLWVIYDAAEPAALLAAGVSCMRQTNRGMVSEIRYIAGREGRRWLRPCLRQFEALSKASGAELIHIEGRLGWRRFLPDYREIRTVIEKRL